MHLVEGLWKFLLLIIVKAGTVTNKNISLSCGEELRLVRQHVIDSPSGVILSPNYPRDYGTCHVLDRKYVVYSDYNSSESDISWIGFYNGDPQSTVYPQNQIVVQGQYSKEQRADFANTERGQLLSYALINSTLKDIVLQASLQSPEQVLPNITAKFKIIYRVASVIPQSGVDSVTTRSEGFLVSHNKFNHGKLTDNSYREDVTSGLFNISGLNSQIGVKLKFHFFQLNYGFFTIPIFNKLSCGDYLVIRGVKGYKDGELKYCGFDDPIADPVELLYPISNNISFQFITRSRIDIASDDEAAGFLIEYKVTKKVCPPSTEHANITFHYKTEDGNSTYLITCQAGYKTIENATTQRYLCNKQQTPLPCIATECHDMLELMRIPRLLIAMKSGGRPVVGSVIIFSCKSNYTLVGNREATCSADGTWTLEGTPECVPNPFTPDASDTMRNRLSDLHIGIIVGVVVTMLLALGTLFVVIFIRRRRHALYESSKAGDAVDQNNQLDNSCLNEEVYPSRDDAEQSRIYNTTLLEEEDQHSYEELDLGLHQQSTLSGPQARAEEEYIYMGTTLSPSFAAEAPNINMDNYVTGAYIQVQAPEGVYYVNDKINAKYKNVEYVNRSPGKEEPMEDENCEYYDYVPSRFP